MPYDKGDFTQQGIDGKVAGGLLLNNKRDVDVIVSSNEDDSTLGSVTVTIEDHLNDLKYAFEGENLEAGEVYEIGAGGGDFKTVELEFEVLSGDCALNAPVILTVEPYYMVPSFLAIDSSMTLNTVISTANTTLITITPGAGSEVHEISGDIELLSDNNYILSGNAKVTIKAR